MITMRPSWLGEGEWFSTPSTALVAVEWDLMTKTGLIH